VGRTASVEVWFLVEQARGYGEITPQQEDARDFSGLRLPLGRVGDAMPF